MLVYYCIGVYLYGCILCIGIGLSSPLLEFEMHLKPIKTIQFVSIQFNAHVVRYWKYYISMGNFLFVVVLENVTKKFS